MSENIATELQRLRQATPELEMDSAKAELFDEFIREHEFGLALHVLCDFLLEQRGTVDENILKSIEILHARMDLNDDCVAQLKMR